MKKAASHLPSREYERRSCADIRFFSTYHACPPLENLDFSILSEVTLSNLSFYDAWDLENAANSQLVAPRGRSCWFVRNSDYAAYDTLACVGNLKKAMKAGDMMSEEDILKLQQNSQQNGMDGVARPSRRWLKLRRQQRK